MEQELRTLAQTGRERSCDTSVKSIYRCTEDLPLKSE